MRTKRVEKHAHLRRPRRALGVHRMHGRQAGPVIFEHRDERPTRQRSFGKDARQTNDARAFFGQQNRSAKVVRGHARMDFLRGARSSLAKGPLCGQPRHAHDDQRVLSERPRSNRCSLSREVARAREVAAAAVAHANRDELGRSELSHAKRNVEALARQVHSARRAVDLELQPLVPREQRREHVSRDLLDERRVNADAQPTHGRSRGTSDTLLGALRVGEREPRLLDEQLSLRREPHGASRANEQLDAEPRFERPNPIRERRLAQPSATRGCAESTSFDDSDERRELSETALDHWYDNRTTTVRNGMIVRPLRSRTFGGMSLLLLGSSGTVGRALVDRLTSRSVAFTLGRRAQREQDAREVCFDFDDPSTWPPALDAIDVLFLVSPNVEQLADRECAVVEAAVRAGVRKVVKISVMDASADAFELGRVHHRVERTILESGIGYVLLRPNSFMQNFTTYGRDAVRAGRFYSACAGAAVSRIDVRDLADVAAIALTSATLDGQAIELTGPSAPTDHEAAAELADRLGHNVQCVPIDEASQRRSLLVAGVPAVVAERLVDLARYQRTGGHARISDAVQQITKRRARTFAQFARDHTAAWR